MNCKGYNSCEIDPNLFRLKETISPKCISRVENGEIHHEYIIVVGCQKLFIQIPMTKIELKKEQISIYISFMNSLAMLIIAYFFYKIETLNSEYMLIMDSICV